MSLQQKIDQDLKQAMVSGDAARVATLRFLKSALQYAAIEKKADSLGDAEIQQVIQKQLKQRRESIQQFSGAGRQDLADKETHEAGILESYLPKQLSDDELEREVRAQLQSSGGASKKDFGKYMKSLTDKLAGRADAKRISQTLGKLLQ